MVDWKDILYEQSKNDKQTGIFKNKDMNFGTPQEVVDEDRENGNDSTGCLPVLICALIGLIMLILTSN